MIGTLWLVEVWTCPKREVGRLLAYGSFAPQAYYATGDLDSLIRSYSKGQTPIGIVLDRLEEYPNELEGITEEDRQLVLDWLRKRYPTLQ